MYRNAYDEQANAGKGKYQPYVKRATMLRGDRSGVGM